MNAAHSPLPDKARPARIAVLSGWMLYYEPHMAPDFRARRLAWLDRIAGMLGAEGEARSFGLAMDDATSGAIAEALAAWKPDAIVIAPAMPMPPAYLVRALASVPRVPVVLWTASQLETLPPDYGSVAHLENSGGVGLAMIGNMLGRAGRSPRVVPGRWDDPAAQEALCRAVRAAAAAGRVTRARVGVLGAPLDGYDNVSVPPGVLADGVGAELVPVALPEWEQALADVPDSAAAAVADSLRAVAEVSEGPHFDRSCRLAAALEGIAARHHLDCGTLNSHLDFGNRNPRIGMTGSLATSWLTSIGIPFTDTGDTVTAIAMLIGRRLSGTSVYTELNMIDYGADGILLANTGEADLAATLPGAAWIVPAGDLTGKALAGCILDAEFRPGAATILGFTPRPDAPGGLRLIAFSGAVVDRPDIALRVPHHRFRPDRLPAPEGFARWIEAGATHHAALCLGPGLATAAADVARHLGIGFEEVA